MAKNKRKISSSQRDKSNILRAKILKEAGIISKRANLHSGRYISAGVLKKVREYQHEAQLGYKAYAATKEQVRAAQQRGFKTVAGSKIIGPKGGQFAKRIKAGELTGIRPVRGGVMEEVILPHTVFDMRSLVEQLGEGIDTLKLPEEYFAFKYKGNESYRPFRNTEELLHYMRGYKSLMGAVSAKPEDQTEEFENFTIFRLHRSDIQANLPTVRQRKERSKQRKREAIARGEYIGTPTRAKTKQSRAEKIANMYPAMARKYLEKQAAKDRARRAALQADPLKLAAYKDAARKRAKASRDRKKGK